MSVPFSFGKADSIGARAIHLLSRPGFDGRVFALVGLGSSLTPAGDDFLGGLLFVAYHLNVLYPGVFRWEQKTILNWLKQARAQTHPISYAILCDHASGQGVEPLYNLLGAIS